MVKTRTGRTPPGRAAPATVPVLGMGTGLAAAIFFGLALLYFLPALMPGRGIYGTDYLAGGYPFSEFLAGRLRAGELPKWVPYIFGGMPFFANPGSTFYPVWTLSALLIPISKVLPVLFVVQFGLAGLGMFLLARELRVRPWVAFLAGLAFEFTGLAMSYVYAGQDGRIIVATLAPLFLFFLHRLVRRGSLGAFVGSAATLAFSLLSFQIQSNYYLLLAGLIWAIFLLLLFRVRGRALGGRLALGVGSVVLAFAIASVNFLPFLNYAPASTRGTAEGRGYEYSTSWSMPPEEITGLAVPEMYGSSVQNPSTGQPEFPAYHGRNFFKLHTEYAGAFVLALLVLGVWYGRKSPYWWFFLGLTLFALTLSFGGHTPLYRLYYALLPGTKRFRAPSISFYLVSLSLTAMAAITLDRLARVREQDGAGGTMSARARGIALGLAVVGLLLIAIGGSAGASGARGGFIRFGLFLALIGAALWAWLAGRFGTRTATAVLALVLVADLWVVDRHFLHTVPPPSAWYQADGVINELRAQAGTGRVWVLPVPGAGGRGYAHAGNDLMLYDIDQVGGEHPDPLQSWYQYVGVGSHGSVDWHNLVRSSAFLNAANVRWIVSMARLEGVEQLPPLRLIHAGSALVYENPDALPRAYLVDKVLRAPAPDGALAVMADSSFDPRHEAVLYDDPGVRLPGGTVTGDVRIVSESPDAVRLAVRADRPALLVLADNYYPGWQATVDGTEVRVLRADHTFRAVVVPAGEHDVRFEFRPERLHAGFGIYLAGLLALAVGAVMAWLRSRRGSRGPTFEVEASA